MVTRRGVELHDLRARYRDTGLVATGLVVTLWDEVRELHFPRAKELFQFTLKVSAALAQGRVQNSSFTLVEVEPIAHLLSHEPLNLVFQFNSHRAVVLGDQLLVQGFGYLNVLHTVVQHLLREGLPLHACNPSVLTPCSDEGFLELIGVLTLHETEAITVGFQRVRTEQATWQLLLLHQPHVDVLDVGVDEAAKNQSIQHLSLRDVEPRVQLLEYRYVVVDDVVSHDQRTIGSTIHEQLQAILKGSVGTMVVTPEDCSFFVLDDKAVTLGHVVQKAVGLNVKDEMSHTFSLSSN